ncbi:MULTISPECIES: DNA recombination protein RmuC [unclassified Corynebacterium]|uniref:DNA recombination protein RmuC n=1 Tax=unclassified Corynebacterium TaxID=2624378 RepID=UPI001EF5BD3C|nr:MULTISPECIES: DNA recombination protein RmuC [unclassified Corynebacterium]MCG7288653.1 DNA recombination protein RmuC [Corynebacterium sp. ACRPZ]MCG7293041.1 DNA recombination protein RmuC [Corynebacterium sp. ACRPY]
MSTATVLLLLATGLLAGFIAGVFTGAAWMRRSTPQQPPQDLRPVARALKDMREQLDEMDKQQAVSASSLAGQVQAIGRTSARLGDRTDQLITALRSPQTRGRWGEIQLERVVELGGMLEHVDFDTQEHMLIDGSRVRPDMIIRLTQGRNIVVDAKVPFQAYLDALGTEDPEERQAFMRRHAHLVRAHVDTLSAKSYIEAFQPTPEFVVLFVPADPFLDAALSIDPELLDYAFARDVVIATPTTLFALLRTVALGWRQESLNDAAKEIQRLGRQLHQRLATMAEHYNRVGSSLDKAVEAYNATLASMDSRVMVTARKLEEAQVPSRRGEAPALKPVSTRARHAAEDTGE